MKYLIMMSKKLPKFFILFCLIFFGLETAFSNENECFKNKDLNGNNLKKTRCSLETLDDSFMNSLGDYREYKESIKPQNQFIELFGVGGFQDQRLKQNTFDLWDTFQKESTNQIGDKRLHRPDIHNTFNGTLGSLE